ncbi:hypothetical protein EDC18_103295 [Natranaerovirga pectinivora]|uniref:Uncharacterized protein n=1 Tax=Natranaerovirga pectinivora TaxID=682400 RepID=A0A4R3MS13_9FIRM|nr:hypothetical protein [Natranaerovirga pectinivora]TCT15587.1 hypothetical protein EDC18_103295 [Natranaerovirga pectinivora]
MNQKVSRITGIIAGIIAITTGALTIFGKIMIPGLGPFSLAVTMVTLVYSIRYQYKEGKEKRVFLGIAIVAVILNIMAGIAQIVASR